MAGQMIGPFPPQAIPGLQISQMGVIPKGHVSADDSVSFCLGRFVGQVGNPPQANRRRQL